MNGWSKIIALLCLSAGLASVGLWRVWSGADHMPKAPLGPIPAQFTDKSLFLSPIRQASGPIGAGRITGLTVPHHLLARDLIAQAFNFAWSAKPSQILLVSPDHYYLGATNVSVSGRDFATILGDVAADRDAISKLKDLPFVREQDFFYREHGVQAELPYIKYYFPDAKVIVLTFKDTTPKPQVDQVVDKLKTVLTPDSLVVQSTDFSHYLTASEAEKRDKATLSVLAAGDPDIIWNLNQPSNLDSIASMYLQARLQKEHYGCAAEILAHKNSQAYTDESVTSSTSYIVQAYQCK